MKLSTLKIMTPILVALITAGATLGSAFINKPSSQGNTSTNPAPTNPSNFNASECHPTIANKVCVAHLFVQINSDEPQQVKYNQRLPLKAGDTMKFLSLTYCIPTKVKLNKIEAKVYLFKDSIENYQDMLSTPSTFPINTGCHNISNFPNSWQLAAGQHQVSIPIIKYDGSYRVVDKSFYLNLDVGQ
ncbi:hypothetical protein [Anabaena sp. UHCC 0399]|uniref:hypothetical protein n=1 Tax=Anabaena sp. UHCC 0399 TaxID=3110238 RepID=UPI002B1F000B|nr:hypothetical protein [Anabaena sp. UHCC 0399]MEA5565093.1 hypothetical protein [Anabaena sp. UHCC 0399]